MQAIVKGAIEHELQNPVFTTHGSESVVGVTELGFTLKGYTLTDAEEKERVARHILNLARKAFWTRLHQLGWTDLREDKDAESFASAMREMDTKDLWNSFEQLLADETPGPSILNCRLASNAHDATRFINAETEPERLVVFIYVWAPDDISNVDVHVMYGDQLINKALVGQFNAKTKGY